MNRDRNKLEKLVQAARMYYEQDLTQNEIAARFGISRPMVSKLLREAREQGIVHIEIRSPLEGDRLIELLAPWGIRGGKVVREEFGEHPSNRSIARAALDHLEGLGSGSLGLGWGTAVGAMVTLLDDREPRAHLAGLVVPLVGNSPISNRNYHSNELVRIFAQQCRAEPLYLHAPAFFASSLDLKQFQRMESFLQVLEVWESLDTAVVNIGNYPSTPDFATQARYRDLLSARRAVGRLLSYYYCPDGSIVSSQDDHTLQIPLELLRRCPQVVGVCGANVAPRALAGALRTGLLSHLVASTPLIREAIDLLA